MLPHFFLIGSERVASRPRRAKTRSRALGSFLTRISSLQPRYKGFASQLLNNLEMDFTRIRTGHYFSDRRFDIVNHDARDLSRPEIVASSVFELTCSSQQFTQTANAPDPIGLGSFCKGSTQDVHIKLINSLSRPDRRNPPCEMIPLLQLNGSYFQAYFVPRHRYSQRNNSA